MPTEMTNYDSVHVQRGETSDALVLTIGVLLGICLIGLTHASTYMEQLKDGVAIELGAGIEDQEEFEENVNAAPARRKIGFLGLLAIAAYCFFTSPRGASIQPTIVLLLMGCCIAAALASYLWSAGRQDTGRELVRIVAYAGVAYALARRFEPRELLKVIMLMAMVSVLAACAVDVVLGGRPWMPKYRLHGSLHSNLLAHQALIALLVAFALYKSSERPWVWKSIFAASLAIIILTKTRGALGSGIVGLSAIALAGRPFRSLLLIGSCVGTLLVAAALFILLIGSDAQKQLAETVTLGRSKSVGTLTGRIPLWQAILKESKDNRVRGYGYGAFWNTDRTTKLSKQLGWFPGHSHSAYVQTVLDLGYIGASFVLMLVFAGIIRATMLLHATGEPAFKFVFGLLVAGLIDGIVEVSFVYPRELGLFVAIALFMLVVRHPKRRAVSECQEEIGSSPADLSWNEMQLAY